MRITTQTMLDDSIGYMTDNLERLTQLQTRVASGKLIQTPADNPTVAVAGLNMRSTIASNQAYIDTSYVTKDWLNANELALKDLVDIGTRAYTLSEQALSDTLGPAERDGIAQELAGILQHAVDVGNTQHEDKYIFAGFQVKTKPFTLGPAVPATIPATYAVTANYTAPAGTMTQSIAPSQTMPINVDPDIPKQFMDQLANVHSALVAQPFNTAALQTALGNLYTALGGVKDARTTNGARQHQLDAEMSRLDQMDVALKNLLSHKEDVNMAEAISQLNRQQTIYQTSLQVGSKSVTQSLFDYLR